jgi:hypothetical protein
MAPANPTYTPIIPPINGFKSFETFFPFYLGEHANLTNRRLHLIGTSIVAGIFLNTLKDMFSGKEMDFGKTIRKVLGIGYGFAWIGHFFFEKNQPATFTYPLYSLRGDFRMLWEVLTLQRSF